MEIRITNTDDIKTALACDAVLAIAKQQKIELTFLLLEKIPVLFIERMCL